MSIETLQELVDKVEFEEITIDLLLFTEKEEFEDFLDTHKSYVISQVVWNLSDFIKKRLDKNGTPWKVALYTIEWDRPKFFKSFQGCELYLKEVLKTGKI